MHAVMIDEHGESDVMRWQEVPDPSPGPGDVIVELAAAGVNFIDTYHRTGLYEVPLPFVLGQEGSGTVVEVGEEVSDLAVGDRVAWAGVGSSYATRVVVPEGRAVVVPDPVDLETAAALMLQGMTAHYLAVDTYRLDSGDRCLIHAGAGGVGLLLIQIAKLRGAEVFTTVGSPAKAELAAAAGADHTILYRDVDFAEAITELIGPKGIDVVYDGVGRAVFDASLELLRVRGTMATFGNASGPVDPVSPLRLAAAGSVFLTRPTLFDYVRTREELDRRAADLFQWVAAGQLDVRVGERLPLADAAEAHRRLEGRATTGKVLLVP